MKSVHLLVVLVLDFAVCLSNANNDGMNIPSGFQQKFFDVEDTQDTLQLIDERDIFQGGDVPAVPAVSEESRRKIQMKSSFSSDEVIFSVLESSKSKNEVISLDSRLLRDLNVTDARATNASAITKNKTLTVECLLRVLPEDEIPSVFVANSSVLQTVLVPMNMTMPTTTTTNSTASECAVVLFFSSQCVFSARMAPHYNALARVFPGLVFYALDTSMHNNIHVRYGIVSVPNVLLFHNAKLAARYNETYFNLENLVTFITRYTNLQHNGTLNVTSADMTGPVPATLTKRVDYVLILAWIFTVCCLCLWFLKSSLCHKIVECVLNTWIEAEAQHEHTD